MQYGHVPGIDKPISRLVQGTIMLSTEAYNKSAALLDAIYALGCNTFDSAHVYNQGDCERTLGRWINERGLRDKVVILDKGAHPYGGEKRVTPEDITADIYDSLERLGADYIDLYVLHRDNPEVPVEPIVDILNEHKAAGRIHAFGGSNWSYKRIQAANQYAHQQGLTPFAVSSPQYSLAEMVAPPWDGCVSIGGAANQNARAWYREQAMPLFTWSSLAGGFMTGRFRRDNLETITTALDLTTVKAYCHEANFQRLERAEVLADEKGISLPQLALAYTLSQPLNIFALVGCWQPEEFEANKAALDITLTPAERAWLNLETEARTA